MWLVESIYENQESILQKCFFFIFQLLLLSFYVCYILKKMYLLYNDLTQQQKNTILYPDDLATEHKWLSRKINVGITIYETESTAKV